MVKKPTVYCASEELGKRIRPPKAYPVFDYSAFIGIELGFDKLVEKIELLSLFKKAAIKYCRDKKRLPPRAEFWPLNRDIKEWTNGPEFDKNSLIALNSFCREMNFVSSQFADILIKSVIFEQTLSVMHASVFTGNISSLGQSLRSLAAIYFSRQWMQLKESSILAGLDVQAQDLLVGTIATTLAQEVNETMINGVSKAPVLNNNMDMRRFIAAISNAPRSIWSEKRIGLIERANQLRKLDLIEKDQFIKKRKAKNAMENMAEAAGFRIPDDSEAGIVSLEIFSKLNQDQKLEYVYRISRIFATFMMRCIARKCWTEEFQSSSDNPIYEKATSTMICKTILAEIDLTKENSVPPLKIFYWMAMPRYWQSICRLIDHPSLRYGLSGESRIRV